MDASILLARIIGPLFLSVAVGVLLNPDFYRAMFAEFLKNRSLVYFSGAMALVAGIVMVSFHNIWAADWRVILTVIGWMSVLKGVSRTVFPGLTPRFAKPFVDNGTLLKASAVVLIGFGTFLTYKGFIA